MSKIYEIATRNNGVMKWNTALKPRLSSGFVGDVTLNIQITADEMAEIQKTQPQLLNKELAEMDYLSKYGIVREIKADTTKAKTTLTPQEQKIAKLKKSAYEYTKAGKTDDEIKAIIRSKDFFKSGRVTESDITDVFKSDVIDETDDIDF